MHLEDSKCNEASKGGRQDVARIQDRYPGSQLLASVESRQHVQSAGIVRSFGNSQKESCEKKSSIILAHGCEAADDCPDRHTGAHPPAWTHSSYDHIGRDTHDDISRKKNGHASLILCRGEVEVLFESVESRESDSISILVRVNGC